MSGRPRDVLVIHPGALGDILLTVPALRALRAAGGRVTIAAQPRLGALLVALGVVDHAVAFDTLGLEALFADAPLGTDAPLARLLASASRVVSWFGARDEIFARRLRALVPGAVVASPAPARGLVWEHLLGSIAELAGADRTPIAPSAVLVEEGRRSLRDLGCDGASRVLLVHPGAGGAAKRWPIEGFVAVVDNVDATIVVHQGPADAEAVRALLERMRRPVHRLIDPPLPVLAGALSHAAGYLGNDSGVSHLAAAVGAPSLILFTDAARPWMPWSPAARTLVVRTDHVIEDDCRAVRSALRELV